MITLMQLSMRFGEKILFQNANIQFNKGNRYGIVGSNGSGKSTLLKILAGEEIPEAGDVNISSLLKLGTLKQDHYLYENDRVIDVVIKGRIKLWEALHIRSELLKKDTFSDAEAHQFADLESVIVDEQGYSAEPDAAKLLVGLGIAMAHHEKPLSLLSGGYKLRVLLAQVFFSQPDILILDEPTNHLDLYSIRWLENYLCNYEGTLILTSHDRDFLNRVCTSIADLDYGTITLYKGNYDQFLMLKQQMREQKELQLGKQEKQKADLQDFIDRFKAKASKAKQAQSKMKLVEKIDDKIDALDLSSSSRAYPKINFQQLRPSGVVALDVKTISKSFGSKQVLNQVSFQVDRGDKLAIIGPNGIGKSTLLEIITGHLAPNEGTFQLGFGTTLSYFPQDPSREADGSQSLLDWLSQWDRSVSQEKLRGILGLVLFSGDTVKQSISTLSGGEKARLIVAKMMLLKGNVLIFDEPTNHLDIESIDVLTDALLAFEGTVIVVSHNRYFVSKIASRVIEITHDGVHDYRGSYDEYVEQREKDYLSRDLQLKNRYADELKTSPVENKTKNYEEQKRLKNLKNQQAKQAAKIESDIVKMEQSIKKIDLEMALEGFYDKDPLEISQRVQEKEALEATLHLLMQKWEASQFEEI